jgi:hypothetical protein
MSTEKCQKMPIIFYCQTCDFKCCKTSNYNKHLLTSKHKNQQIVNKINILSTEKMPYQFQCECGKKYKERSGLWRHKKKCHIKEIHAEIFEPVTTDKDLISLLIKDRKEMEHFMIEQNIEFKKMVIDITKNQATSIIHNTTNSHNKTFNLQVFLNETCKNAMNIMEFVENVKINLSDLENVGKLGYVDGITNIIINNLKDLDISKRPVHCSDLKREVLYIKDENQWIKESEEKDKFRNAIKHIAHKNVQMIPEWKQKNPTYSLDDGRKNDEYMKIVMESMGGSDKKEDITYENKIMKNVVKNIIIEKE